MTHRTLPLILCVLWALIISVAPQSTRAAEEYSIEVNKGRLIRLHHAATSVIIADPTIADVQVVSPQLIYVNGKKTGETSVFAVDDANEEIVNATIMVTHNLTKLNSTIKRYMPGSDAKFSTIDGALVLSGSAESPLQAEEMKRIATPFMKSQEALVNMLQTKGSDQVTLKVRVAELSRNELKRFGINWEGLISTGNFLFGLGQGRDVVDAAGALTRSGADNSLFGGLRSGSQNINTVIDALEQDGLITILAEPTLTTSSGKASSFLAGGEIPIPVLGQNNQVSIEYKPYGVSLNFNPVVLSKNKISLTVGPEVSTLSNVGQIQSGGFNIPSIVTRRATTTVEVGSGQTFAIAGLLQNNSNNDIKKFPALGDLPILGALFRSSEFKHDQTELVILITPYIVTPVPEGTLKTPLDTYRPATDMERILFGKLYHENPPSAEGSKVTEGVDKKSPMLHGPVGYILP